MWLLRAHFSVKLLSHKWHVNFLHGGEREECKYGLHSVARAPPEQAVTLSSASTAGLVCHVCISRHWFFCPGLALQPFILCFAVGPNGFEKFCYSPVTPEAKVRIDFTCAGLHHLSRAGAVRAKAKWNAIHTQLLRQAPCPRGGRLGLRQPHQRPLHKAPQSRGTPRRFPECGDMKYPWTETEIQCIYNKAGEKRNCNHLLYEKKGTYTRKPFSLMFKA